jgi:hypothetical protein
MPKKHNHPLAPKHQRLHLNHAPPATHPRYKYNFNRLLAVIGVIAVLFRKKIYKID